MTEEETKALKYLEFLSNEKCECEACQRAKKEYKILLNLIEKQQKEIEKYKHTNIVVGRRQYGKTYEITKGYISKDKIREKIRELKNMTVGARTGIYAIQVDILEELLEENK